MPGPRRVPSASMRIESFRGRCVHPSASGPAAWGSPTDMDLTRAKDLVALRQRQPAQRGAGDRGGQGQGAGPEGQDHLAGRPVVDRGEAAGQHVHHRAVGRCGSGPRRCRGRRCGCAPGRPGRRPGAGTRSARRRHPGGSGPSSGSWAAIRASITAPRSRAPVRGRRSIRFRISVAGPAATTRPRSMTNDMVG